MGPFIMPADFDFEYPALHDQSTEMGANIALSQVRLQNFETQRIWKTHHEPFSKVWWRTFCQQGACPLNQVPAFDLYHRRRRREAWRKRVTRTRNMDDYLCLVMDWSGHATSLLSIPPFVASTERYVRFGNMWPDANMDSIKLAQYRSTVELVRSSDEALDMSEWTAADESSLEFSYDDLFAFDRYYDEEVENGEQHRDDSAELGVAEGEHMTEVMDAPILTPVLCHSSRGTDILEVPDVRSSSPTAQNSQAPSCSRPVMADVDPHAAPIQNKLAAFLPPALTTRNLLVAPKPDHQSNMTITAARDSVGSF